MLEQNLTGFCMTDTSDVVEEGKRTECMPWK